MIKGSLVPNLTFFNKNGEIDFEKTEWHMRWMFDRGVDGLFLTGSYGAGPLMSNEERIDIFKLAKKVVSDYNGKILIPHVGCIDTKHTIELAKAAEEIGVDGVSAVPPFYYKHSDEVVINFYKQLIDSVDIPVFAYNNPATSRYTFSVEVVKTLMEYGLAGMKDSPLQISFLSRIAYEAQVKAADFQIIIGTSNGWLPLYFMGVQACIAGINNWAPEIMTELVKATVAGNIERAKEIYVVMMDISQKLHFTDSTIASHMALAARGYTPGYPRQPMALPEKNDPQYSVITKQLNEAFTTLGIAMIE